MASRLSHEAINSMFGATKPFFSDGS